MNKQIPIAELEARMRPGALSGGGFLGPSESLENVISEDHQTLEKLGVSYDEIADVLAQLLIFRMEQWENFDQDAFVREKMFNRTVNDAPTFVPVDRMPIKGLGSVPGYPDLQIFTVGWQGYQSCPWKCTDVEIMGAYDFLIINWSTREYIAGPSLIVHLIRKHHFFEGKQSPYRVDPEKLLRVLGLR